MARHMINRTGIKLVRMQEKHLPAVQLYAAEARVAATCNLPHPYPEDGARTFLEHVRDPRYTGTRVTFAIELSRQFCGICGVGRLAGSVDCAEVGYWIALPYWGKGIATEATRAAARHAFTRMKFRVLTAKALEINVASRRVLEKNGFRLVRTGPEQYAKWPDPQPTCFYELTRAEWKARK